MHEFKLNDHEKLRSFNMWGVYCKTSKTLAVRVDGPFKVETAEGPLFCQDGYLALDTMGRPYPVEKQEFERIYEKKAEIAGKALFNRPEA
jgi:hypothetical protein